MDDKFEITPELLKKMLSEKSMVMTVQEIEEMMDEEVEKPEEEMDTELIDLCASVLCKHYGVEQKEASEIPMYKPWEEEPPKKKFKTIKILPIAAALLLLAAIALPVGAKLMPGEVSDNIIEFYSDHFKLNLLKEETTISDSWLHSLISENLEMLSLPTELISDKYQREYKIEENDNISITYVTLKNQESDIIGKIIVTQYTDENAVSINGSIDVSDMYRYFKQMSVNGLDVFVFGDNKQMYINYVDGAMGYEIALECSFDEAISIANTIKVKDENK